MHRVQKNIFISMAKVPGNRRAGHEHNGSIEVWREELPGSGGGGGQEHSVPWGLSQDEFGDG